MSSALLDQVVARQTLGDHDGRSGATLERLTLDDGTTLVLKHADPRKEISGLLGIPDAELAASPTTLLHADLWPVNLSIDAAGVTFLDWAIATAGPAALECSIFLSGAADHVEASREQIIAIFRRASGDLTDDQTMRVALFASLCDLGWNKALDAAENDDPAQRARGAADLAWWVEAGHAALADLDMLVV